MGTDLCTCLEIKQKGGDWQSYNLYLKNGSEYDRVDLWHGRDHDLFYALAEIGCGPFPTLGRAKGLPPNASKESASFVDEGAVSVGSVTLEQLIDYAKDHQFSVVDPLIASIKRYVRVVSGMDKDDVKFSSHRIRIIFWFIC